MLSTNTTGLALAPHGPLRAAKGDFVWYELLTTEPFASMDFYQHVLGWTSQRLDGVHGHVMYASGAGPMASATTLPELAKQMGAPPYWTSNVQVSSVDEACALAKQLGGRVYLGPVDVAGIGRIAVIADPVRGNLLPVPLRPPSGPDLALFHPVRFAAHAIQPRLRRRHRPNGPMRCRARRARSPVPRGLRGKSLEHRTV